MPRGKKSEDLTTLQMALVGYQIERQKISDKIREIEAQLGDKQPAAAAVRKAGGKKRVLSAAARARIAAAQRKRWAEHRKRAAAAAK
jgi:hypothetical protein